MRLQAAQLFEQDMPPVQVAHQLRVSTKSAYQWRRCWRASVSASAGSAKTCLSTQTRCAYVHFEPPRQTRPCRSSTAFSRCCIRLRLRGRSQAGIAALIRSRMPKDVLAQQEKVAWADGLAFIAPIHFCAFPAILKGWIDRVWTLDFAFGLTSAGWHGDINGRIPLLHHQRALIMTSTIFDKNAYDDGIRDAIGKVIDDWGFRFPGIADVEHVYFYAATSATPDLVKQYFQQAYQLGRDFERPATGAGQSAPAA